MAKPRKYCISLLKDGERVVLQARTDVDLLDCETWKYLGQWVTTKQQLRQKRNTILAEIIRRFNRNFVSITID